MTKQFSFAAEAPGNTRCALYQKARSGWAALEDEIVELRGDFIKSYSLLDWGETAAFIDRDCYGELLWIEAKELSEIFGWNEKRFTEN